MAQQLEVAKTHINEFLHKYPNIDGHVEKVATKIGTEKAYVVMGGLAIPVLLMLAIGTTTLIIDAVGFGYPLYETIKALETPDTEDDKQWLTYWLIFAMFKILESFVGVLLEMIPFYFVIKVAFLVWCYYPSIRGATTVYNQVVKVYVVPAMGLGEAPAKETKSD